ncbi:3296_t:CDS:2, partial [Acaulospora colombiana]
LRSFQELAGRARKDVKVAEVKVAVCLFLFDMMKLNGKPKIENGNSVSKHVMATLDHVESVEADEGREVVEEFWEKAIESKCEGLMIKLLDDTEVLVDEDEYIVDEDEKIQETPRKNKKKGNGARRKALPATYEPALILFQLVHGMDKAVKRVGGVLYSSLCMTKNEICFTDAFYKELNARYPEGSETCTKTPQWNVETGGSLTISPTSVTALGMIPQAREKGLSLRFPRFMRLRPDKSIEMASTPGYVVQLWVSQEKKGQTANEGVEDDGLLDYVEEEEVVEDEYESDDNSLKE